MLQDPSKAATLLSSLPISRRWVLNAAQPHTAQLPNSAARLTEVEQGRLDAVAACQSAACLDEGLPVSCL